MILASSRSRSQRQAFEQRGRLADLRAFDAEQTQLGRDTAGRREAADLTAGRQHAMAWYDDRERILPHRFAHLARLTGVAKSRCDVAIGERGAGGDGARHRINALMELRHALHIECNGRKVARLSAQQGYDVVNRPLDVTRRRRFTCVRKPPLEARPRRAIGPFRQLDPDNAACVPRDSASPDCRIEECEFIYRHDASEHSTDRGARTSRILPPHAKRGRPRLSGASLLPPSFHAIGRMFWFRRKKLSGSYFALSCCSR